MDVVILQILNHVSLNVDDDIVTAFEYPQKNRSADFLPGMCGNCTAMHEILVTELVHG